MSWCLFIDDERWPPKDKYSWHIARNWFDVKGFIDAMGLPSRVSFDHDLGEHSMNGYEIAKKMVDIDMDGDIVFPNNFTYYVHSQNPVGKKNIESYLDRYFEYKGDNK